MINFQLKTRCNYIKVFKTPNTDSLSFIPNNFETLIANPLPVKKKIINCYRK